MVKEYKRYKPVNRDTRRMKKKWRKQRRRFRMGIILFVLSTLMLIVAPFVAGIIVVVISLVAILMTIGLILLSPDFQNFMQNGAQDAFDLMITICVVAMIISALFTVWKFFRKRHFARKYVELADQENPKLAVNRTK